MNFIFTFLVLGSFYIAFVGLWILFFRMILKKLNCLQSNVYQLWLIFLYGFVGLILFYNFNPQQIFPAKLEHAIQLAAINSYQLNNPISNDLFSTINLFVIIWAFVSLVLLVKLFVRYWQFSQSIKQNSEYLKPQIVISPVVLTPFASGILSPKIFLPQTYQHEYSQQQLKLLLAHEKIHCERKDPLVRMLFKIICYLFWFHPLLYLFNKLMQIDQELACDEQVLLENNDHLAYSKLLLQLSQNNQQTKIFNRNSELYCSSISMLKERIMKIKNLRNKTFSNKLLAKTLLSSSIIALLITTSAIAHVVQINQSGMKLNPIPAPEKPPEAPVVPDVEAIQIVPISQPAPYYPRAAAEAKISGFVDVEYRIRQDGHVDNIRIIKAEPATVFNTQAVKSVEKYVFKPINKTTTVKQRIKFSLK